MADRLILVFSFFLVFSLSLFSQDSIRIMHYNLLYYGIYTDFCTPENNNVEQKNQNLKIILNKFRPHIFTVNELGRGAENLDILLNNALNVDGVSYYDYASYTNSNNSSIVNGLFYDSRKFGLIDQSIPNTVLRDINLYKLFYRSEDLENTQDTVFLTCVVGHLKAGQDANDQQTRTSMISNVMNYLNQNDFSGNLLFLGDFNMQSSYEQAFQVMISHPNPEIRLNDPIDLNGIWNNNSDIAGYHTQSTHTSGNGCFVTGGLDDRFDFILISNSILNGTNGFKYIENSYNSPGQDGIRFNQSLVSPANLSLQQNIIDALYNFSDHLPVIIELTAEKYMLSVLDKSKDRFKVQYNNPVRGNLKLLVTAEQPSPLSVKLFYTNGMAVDAMFYNLHSGINTIDLNLNGIKPGVYVLELLFSDNDGYRSRVVVL